MKLAVPVFPGSNCDADCVRAVEDSLPADVAHIWHTETNLDAYDGIIIPGGFSYGDYLRPGAIARFSPITPSIRKAAESGKLVIGICNGFQVLLEMGLLPGAMRRNDHLQFRCETVPLKVENGKTPFTLDYEPGEIIRLPIAHGEGNYYCDEATYDRLKEENRIVFTYAGNNPNGSVGNIAGLVNEGWNVFGLMPHPERAVHEWMGSNDGRRVWTSMYRYWREKISV